MERIVTYTLPADPTERARRFVALAQNYTIGTAHEYEAAAEDLTDIKSLRKSLDEERKAAGKPLRDELETINEHYRNPLIFLDQAEDILSSAILKYRREQEERAREAQRQAEAAARAAAEKAAREVAEREAAARAEAEARRREAAAAAEAGHAEAAAALKAQAEHVEAIGKAEAAALADIAQQTIAVPAPTQTYIPAVKGMSARSKWKARVRDKAKFLAFVAANPAFHNLADANDSALNALAAAQREGFQLPGCEAYQEDSLTNRRRA
jgi:hypothetical protein